MQSCGGSGPKTENHWSTETKEMIKWKFGPGPWAQFCRPASGPIADASLSPVSAECLWQTASCHSRRSGLLRCLECAQLMMGHLSCLPSFPSSLYAEVPLSESPLPRGEVIIVLRGQFIYSCYLFLFDGHDDTGIHFTTTHCYLS